ncbi:FAD-dependent oxidoreductase [Akkermansiaceae bacterium]|nr:FAD-dependent oxidoreductase [Akkermansiaceae bacterium]
MKDNPISRRQFIGKAGSAALFLLAGSPLFAQKSKSNGEFLFLEAEQFMDHGGWDLDQQSMDQMGSPYLLAHGMGIAVKDAVTKVKFPSAGKYRLWVRTRDWVAPWGAPGAPGKFQVLLDGKPAKEVFGTKGADWHWHDGGLVEVNEAMTIALHDLTGFEGRCEAILFCKDTSFQPTNDVNALSKFRRKLLNLPEEPEEGDSFDLVVIGAGLSGTCAAISAARNGLKVALVQDRPVLGGNGSSEVRVWPEGHTQKEPYPHIGDITEEILPQGLKKIGRTFNGSSAEYYDDDLKMKIVAKEPLITPYINHRAMDVASSDSSIKSIVIQSTISARRQRIYGKFFADCTGDAKVGHLAGADYEYSVGGEENLMGSSNLFSVLDASDKEQVLGCECKDKSALTMAYEESNFAQPFPRCPWALDLSDKPFPGRKKFSKSKKDDLSKFERMWYWESGFDKDQIEDIEWIRDLNLRAMYGAWDALKNVDGLYPNHRLGWSAFIAGKRESRRLMGDVILDAKDFTENTEFPDAAYPCSWHIDLHFPEKKYQDGFEGNEFISDFTRGKGYKYNGIYWAPYRTLYSRNIDNLFMAGRDISVTKTGLGPVRVMKTCGMMGEIVGMAAAVCMKKNTSPRGVYETHLTELQKLMKTPQS